MRAGGFDNDDVQLVHRHHGGVQSFEHNKGGAHV
jgi:hypothetical protein